MIMYIYQCDDCGKTFEIGQSIKDDRLTNCPECNSTNFYRLIQMPLYVRVIGEPTTVGQLAERNKKTLSSEQIAKLKEENKTKKTISRIPHDQLPAHTKLRKKEPLPEWMAKARTKTHKDILKMSPKQIEKYIHTGE